MDVVNVGDVYICDFSLSAHGQMQDGKRPCVIVDNNMAAIYSPCVHCVPLTSKCKKDFKLHFEIYTMDCNGLSEDSIALCEQYTLIDKSQLCERIGKITKADLLKIIELCKMNFPFKY